MFFGQNLPTMIWMVLNATSSILIVYVNKVIFQNHSFTYGTLLTAIHFFITSIGLFICQKAGVFETKRIPILKILPLCISFCGFVTLTNLSLLHNNVGFYQLMKVLTTPMLVLIQSTFYDKTFSLKVKLSLTLICVGVVLATFNDASANLLGTIIALSALLVTCMYQIWVGTKQTEFHCDPFQLLYNQAPLSAIMLLPISFFSDHLSSCFLMPCGPAVLLILLSGLLAFVVNISIFFVIGMTSPVTYNVLGHFKLCAILFIGFLFFSDPINKRIVIGTAMAIGGVFWYTHARVQDNKKERSITRADGILEEDHGDGDSASKNV